MERIKSLDISKGISILLMTFSHLLVIKKHPELTELNIHYLMIFKMPLFIIISGFLYSNKRTLRTYALSKVDSLLKPTVNTIALFSLFALLFSGSSPNVLTSIKNAVAQAIVLAFPLWFIFSLFLSLLIFRLIFYVLESKNNDVKFPVIFCILLILSLLNVYNLKYYFFNPSTIIYFLLYLSIGYLIKTKHWLNGLLSKHVWIYSVLIFFTFILAKQKIDINLSLTNNVFAPFFLTLLYSIVGTIMIWNVSNLIARQKWLAWFLNLCGQSSFFILSFHILFGNVLIPKLLPQTNQSYFFDILTLILTIAGCILIKEGFARIKITRYLFLPNQKY
ncbi:acyltransferase family protein [Sphingobacterium suaedae]|uniref:Acyltransferase family protein n=1 Tax=Sphingobacterium suaedae TaxID=1686402 RepID=A0ABW5KPB5_9SPHI